jgi:hypothetical protein
LYGRAGRLTAETGDSRPGQYVDPTGFGLSFDGEDDYAIITDPSARSYAADGRFTVSFFFSKAECKTFSAYQQVYSGAQRSRPLATPCQLLKVVPASVAALPPPRPEHSRAEQ